jgi:hypothetical protein
LLFQKGRRAIGRSVVAIIIVLVLIGVAAAAYFSIGPSSSTSGSTTTTSTSSSTSSTASGAPTQTTSGSNSSTSAAPTIIITNMYADVIGFGLQAPYENSSSVADRSTWSGTPGELFNVTFDVVYQDCASACPSQITAVIAKAPFLVVGQTSPPLPVGVIGTTTINMEATFLVTVKAPSAPYTGTLTLTGQGG